MSTPTRILLIVALGLVLAAGGFAAWYLVQPARTGAIVSGETRSSGSALIGGPFTLTDQTGARRSEADLRGRYALVYFGYTYCPDVCPTSLSTMSRAIDQLAETAPDKAAAVLPVFITVDPERDTVEALATYASNFHPRMMALTGTPEEIAAAAKAYRIYYQRVEEPDASDYLMDHSSVIYLMGPDGNYLTHFTHVSTVDEIAEGLAAQVDPTRATAAPAPGS
jgi:cytochrome oxidase Cu insertion factor (SCO1/SenC/PrrC family)